jgi:hypothetical protein
MMQEKVSRASSKLEEMCWAVASVSSVFVIAVCVQQLV